MNIFNSVFRTAKRKALSRQSQIRYSVLLWGFVLLVWGHLLAKPPERIVSLAPNITEIIFKLNVQNRLVGRTEYCRYPPAVKKIPSVGGYLDTNYEKILALHPDLIVMLPSKEKRRKLESLGLRVLELPDETIPDILQSIIQLGDTLGVPRRAKVVVQGIKDTLEVIEKKSRQIPYHPTALLLIGRQKGELRGLYAAGVNSYLGQLWRLAGGRNVFPEISLRYFSVNLEDLLGASAEIILEFHPPHTVDLKRRNTILQLWQTFTSIPAVKNKNVYIYDDDMFLIPGPRVARVALEFYRLVTNFEKKP